MKIFEDNQSINIIIIRKMKAIIMKYENEDKQTIHLENRKNELE